MAKAKKKPIPFKRNAAAKGAMERAMRATNRKAVKIIEKVVGEAVNARDQYEVTIIVKDQHGHHHNMICPGGQWSVFPLEAGYPSEHITIVSLEDLTIWKPGQWTFRHVPAGFGDGVEEMPRPWWHFWAWV